MGATNITEKEDMAKVEDDISNVKVEDQVDENKLAALKAKMSGKSGEKMAAKIVEKKNKSVMFGVVGLGQGGSRLASEFYAAVYPTICMNTASQDLKFIPVPDTNKLLLTGDGQIQGAARELEIGLMAVERNEDAILELVNEKFDDSVQCYIVCSSLGGGSGSGGCARVVELLSATGKPIVMIGCLPMQTEDVKMKKNSLDTLAKLAKLTESKIINNLIVIDNAKLEVIYSHVSQMNFFEEANKGVISILDKLNTLSQMPSPIKSYDSAEFVKNLLSNGLSTFAEITTSQIENETDLAECIINNLDGSLLCSGFDLTQATSASFLIVGSKSTWNSIPNSSVNYARSILGERCGNAEIYSGMYVVNDLPDGEVKIITFISGLGLPSDRVSELKNDVKTLSVKVEDKEKSRSLNLKLEGASENLSVAEMVKRKVQSNSAFGKLMGQADRRKK